ncbi:MAG: hypothetical protein ABMA25_17420 [Ilumatobacteraceae bacterium]
MDLFGYDVGFRDREEPESHRLGEITIGVRDVAELRRIAAFITHAAEQLELHGERFGHEHSRDWYVEWSDGSPDVVVARIP